MVAKGLSIRGILFRTKKKMGSENAESLATDGLTTAVEGPTVQGDANKVDTSSEIAENPTTPDEDSAPSDPTRQEEEGATAESADNGPLTRAQDETSRTESKSSSAPTSTPKETKSKRPQLPPFIDDPSKITIKFIFANRDGLFVIIDCKPGDTVGEVKGQLMSMWPNELPGCTDGERLRLICMGKGILGPDARTMEDCQVPVFKTHATPINVSMKPAHVAQHESTKKSAAISGSGASRNRPSDGTRTTNTASTGCSCVII